MVLSNGSVHSLIGSNQYDDFEVNPLPVAKPQDDINTLNIFLSNSIGQFLLDSLQGQNYVNFKDELAKLLETCRKNTPDAPSLVVFQDLSANLSSDHPVFECSYSSPPLHLPLPISLSWIPDQPLTIKCTNPAIRLLLQKHLLPEGPYSDYYEVFLKHNLERSIFYLPTEHGVKHTLYFRQHHLEYTLDLTLIQIIMLFFPKAFVEIVSDHPEHDYSSIIQELFKEYHFEIRDPRLDGKLASTNVLLVESLLVNDSLALLPKTFIQSSAVVDKFQAYLYFLLRHGVTPSGPTLSDKIIHSLFTLGSILLENGVDPKNDTLLFNYLYEAFTIVKARNATLTIALEQLPFVKSLTKHSTYEEFVNKKSAFHNTAKDGSFLLRDLFGSSPQTKIAESTPPKTFLPITKVAIPALAPKASFFINLNRKLQTYILSWMPLLTEIFSGKVTTTQFMQQNPKLAFIGAALTEALIRSPSGNHLIIVSDADLECTKSWLVNFHFNETISTAWKIAFRRKGVAAVFPEFKRYFANHFGKWPMASGYDQILLDIAGAFTPELMLQLLAEITFDASHMKKVIRAHFVSFEKQHHNPVMKLLLQGNFQNTMAKVYECISGLNHDDNSFNFCMQVFEIAQQCQNKSPPDVILVSLNKLFDDFEEQTKSSAVVRESYFLLTCILALMNPTRSPIDQVEPHLSNEAMQRFMYLSPQQIQLCQTSQDLLVNIPQGFKLNQILIASHNVCTDELLKTFHAGFATLCIDGISRPIPQLLPSPTIQFRVASQAAQVKPVNQHFVLQTAPQSKSKLPIKGFLNKNNTCFINAALQALFCTRMSKELFNKTFPEGGLEHTLQRLKTLYTTDFDLDDTYEKLIKHLFETVPDIKNGLGKFHDVVPVLEEILDKLKYPLQWDETYSALGDVQLLIQSKTKRHPLFVLPIPMRTGANLQELIDQAQALEEIHDENNRWNEATTVQGQVQPLSDYSTKHTFIEPLPDMLFVQLKRWKWDELAFDMVKDTAEIVSNGPITIGATQYTLKAVIHQNHELFHYHAEVNIDGKWYRCDDKAIEPIAKPDPANGYVFVLEKGI